MGQKLPQHDTDFSYQYASQCLEIETLLDEEKLSKMNNLEKVGTIYNCNGPYKFIEDWGEEDEEEDSWE